MCPPLTAPVPLTKTLRDLRPLNQMMIASLERLLQLQHADARLAPRLRHYSCSGSCSAQIRAKKQSFIAAEQRSV